MSAFAAAKSGRLTLRTQWIVTPGRAVIFHALLANFVRMANLWLDHFLKRVIAGAAAWTLVPIINQVTLFQVQCKPVKPIETSYNREQGNGERDEVRHTRHSTSP